MNFFNSKEDVIDLKLTQYGKHLLSKGKLIPKYYAFYDDDIIYDIRWVTGSLTERQSDIEDRIQDQTPRPRVQHCFHGVETEIKKTVELVRQKKAKLGDDMLQPMASKHHALSLQLGNSSLSSNSMPAWQVYFLGGQLSGSVEYTTGSSPNMKIPQLDCKIEYRVFAHPPGGTSESAPPSSPGTTPAGFEGGDDTDFVGPWGGEYEFEDGSVLQTVPSMILLEVEESNTDYLNENFDIEVYEVKTIPGSGSQQPGRGKGAKEELIPLYFARQTTDLGAMYLTNAPEGSAQSVSTIFPDVDPNYVEYFFDINVDREIDRQTVCENLPEDKARSLYLQQEFKCPDEAAFRTLRNLADGLYDTERQDLDEFEDCD